MALGEYYTKFDNPTVYNIRVPRDLKWRPELAEALIRRFLTGEVVLRVYAENKAVKWQIIDVSDTKDDTIRTSILSVYPTAKVEKSPLEPVAFTEPYYTFINPLMQSDPFIAPIAYPAQLKQYDPLVPFSNLMNDLRPNEKFIYTLYMGKHSDKYHQQADKLLRRGGGEVFARNFLLGALKAPGHVSSERYIPELQKVLEEKVNDLLFVCYVFFEIQTPVYERIAHFWTGFVSTILELRSELNALVPYEVPSFAASHFSSEIVEQALAEEVTSFQFLKRFDIQRKYKDADDKAAELRSDFRCILNPREIASLWHLPHAEFTSPFIEWIEEEKSPLPAEMHGKQDGVFLGYGQSDGQILPAYMLEKDRAMHTLITGQTGAGKSTLIHNLIHQDIEQGRGIALIDPKGNLVQDVLQRSIAAGREDDVVVWDIANTEFPPPLNFLLNSTGLGNPEAMAIVMAVFNRHFGKDFYTKEMAETLQRSFETIMIGELPTIRDVRKLLNDFQFRASLVEQTSNVAVKEFWEDFDAMVRGQGQFYRPVIRRLRQLYGNDLLHPILCNPAMINVRELMEQKKILLFSLRPPEGQSPPADDISILGSIILSTFQLAVSTKKLDEPFYLYIDEAHRFVTSALDRLFTMARSQNLPLILATQYPKQLPADILQDVLENAGATFAFKCADDTARIMKGRMSPQFDASDLIELDLYQAAARILYKGKQMPAFLLETQMPPTLPEHAEEIEADLRKQSDERNSRAPRHIILKWLSEKYPRGRNRPQNEPKSGEDAYNVWGGSGDKPDTSESEHQEPLKYGKNEDIEDLDHNAWDNAETDGTNIPDPPKRLWNERDEKGEGEDTL